MRETWVRSSGQEDTLEKEMATHSSTPAWKIPWTEEPDRLQSMGLQSQTRLSDFTFSSARSWSEKMSTSGFRYRVEPGRQEQTPALGQMSGSVKYWAGLGSHKATFQQSWAECLLQSLQGWVWLSGYRLSSHSLPCSGEDPKKPPASCMSTAAPRNANLLAHPVNS